MAEHITEEEQAEALKRWWNDNWLSIVLPIVLALGGYVGWNAWDAYKARQAEAASIEYQSLLDMVEVGFGQELDPNKRLNAKDIANSIVSSYPGGMYADLSRLMLAKFAVEDKDLAQAASLLQAVVDEGANASISELAKTRLARVLSAQGKHDAALALVSSTSEPAYKALMAEIRGDIHFAQGQISLSRTAYQEALDGLDVQQFMRQRMIRIKLDSTSAAEPAAVKSEAAEANEGDA
ncbi:MAG: tetratricopeptide repeat protein [Cellvibrionaceae bacterium]|nr:tetratricopeptide repeat protein [Cellvibrionaceae bacterium]